MSKKKRRYGNAVENAEMRSSGYGYLKLPEGVRVFTPEMETVAVIDIIPYEVTDKHHMDKIEVDTVWYKKSFKIHRDVGVEKDSIVCPTTFGKPCPICEHQSVLREEGEASEEKLKKLNAKYRSLYLVKVLSYEDGKKKFDKKILHIFDFSDHLFQKIFETQLKRKGDFKDFFLPDSGKSLEIVFDKKSFGEGKPFPIATRVDFVKRKKQYKESIIDEVPNLDEVLTVLSYEDLDAKFNHDAIDSDDTDKKKNKKSKKDNKSKKKDKESKEKSAPKKDKEKSKDKKKNKEATTSGTKNKMKDKKDKTPKDECPYNHTFGKDCDKFDDCADCDLWNECKAAKKALKKSKKGK